MSLQFYVKLKQVVTDCVTDLVCLLQKFFRQLNPVLMLTSCRLIILILSFYKFSTGQNLHVVRKKKIGNP